MTVEKWKPIEHKEDKRKNIEDAADNATKKIEKITPKEAEEITKEVAEKITKETEQINSKTYTTEELTKKMEALSIEDFFEQWWKIPKENVSMFFWTATKTLKAVLKKGNKIKNIWNKEQKQEILDWIKEVEKVIEKIQTSDIVEITKNNYKTHTINTLSKEVHDYENILTKILVLWSQEDNTEIIIHMREEEMNKDFKRLVNNLIKERTFTSNEVQEVFSFAGWKEINQESCKTNAHKFIDWFAKKHKLTPEQITQAKTMPLPTIQAIRAETPADMANVINYFNTITPEPNPTLTQYTNELKQGTITPQNQKAYNNLLHIFATGKGLSATEIQNQKTTREQEQNMKKLQENFEKAKDPDQQMKVLSDAIDTTGEKIGNPSLKSAFDALISGDIKTAMAELGRLFNYIFGIIGGKKLDANEKLFNHKKLDFTNTNIINLIWSNPTEKNEQWKPKIDSKGSLIYKNLNQEEKNAEHAKIKDLFDEEGNLKEEEILKNKNSLYSKIYHKKNTCWLTRDIMYTSALSKLKDTLYLKRKLAKNNKWKRDTEVQKNDPNTSEDESANNAIRDQMKKDLKTYRSKENQEQRILRNVKAGDLVFFVGWDTIKNGKVQKNIINKWLEVAWWPGNHVGIVWPDGKTLIHSTMKKYGTGKSGGHEVPLIEEFNSRPNAGLVIGRMNGVNGASLAQRAQELAPKVKYDHTEAITSLKEKHKIDLSKEEKPRKDYFAKRYNCASFIDHVVSNTPIPQEKTTPNKTDKKPETYASPIPQTWLPSELMAHENITLNYTTQRHG